MQKEARRRRARVGAARATPPAQQQEERRPAEVGSRRPRRDRQQEIRETQHAVTAVEDLGSPRARTYTVHVSKCVG